MRKLRVYIASSWRNQDHENSVEFFKSEGFEVYDYRNPNGIGTGFHWESVDADFKKWSARQALDALRNSSASEAFYSDMHALDRADAVVALAPHGASVGMEVGYAVGRGIPVVWIQSEPPQPELMAKMCQYRVSDIEEAAGILQLIPPDSFR
ncbi:MAG: hypothetical protein PHT84_05615 [Candidatus Pacebacteria bacterium]|nr:hypothetical protein [Candidatus Paceibacterota bacterium]